MASRKTGTLRGVVLAGTLAAVSGLCGAQQTPPGQIDYGPLAVSAVPTLGETMLAALVLLLMAAAYRSLRGRVNGRVLSSLLVGGAATVLGNLLPHYLNFQVFQFLLEAKASEHSARMVAMKSATDNAKQLIKDLTLEYNKLRQANITKELLEITSAAMAMG